jgi:hypothetical protein
MAINYPTSLDNFTNPTSSSPINNPSHADQHANANDAIEALEAKVGVTGSTVSTSHDYRIAQVESLVTSAVAGAKSIYQDVRNQSGSSLSKATPVYVSGSEGASGKMLISAASNAVESTSSKTMGITTSAIANNSNGQVISEGILEGIDTTGAADGDPVWLGTNGAKIYGLANKPSAPSHLVFLGVVIRGGQANTGSMYVKIQNGFELEELHNVQISSLINGNIIAYDSTAGTWKNTNTLQSTSSTVPLVIKGSNSQTANLQEWQDSNGTTLSRVGSGGDFYSNAMFGYYLRAGTQSFVDSTSLRVHSYGSAPNVVIKNTVGTYDLTQWQNSSGTVLANVNASGYFTSAGLSSGGGSGTTDINATAGNLTVRGSSAFSANASVLVGTGYAGGIGVIVKGYASQTANLQEWQNSSGTVLTRIDSYGAIRTTAAVDFNNTSTGSTTAIIRVNYPATTPLYVAGTSSQTANLTEWANSAGTVLARVDKDGFIYSSLFSSAGNLNAGYQIIGGRAIAQLDGSAVMGMVNWNASYHTLQLRNASSQTADSLRIENSSGTVLAKVDSSGNLFAPTLQSTTASTATLTTNGDTGGLLILQNADANKGLVIRRNSSNQYGLAFEVQSQTPSTVFAVTGFGQTIIRGGSIAALNGVSTALLVNSGSTTFIPLAIQLQASQTADAMQIADSSSTVLLRINPAGQVQAPQPAKQGLIVKAATTLTATITNASGSGTTVTYTASNTFTAGQTVTITGVNPSAYNLSSVTIATASATQFTVTNAATGTYVSGGTATVAQTADLQQWQNSSGTVLAKVSSDGTITAGNITSTAYAFLTGTTYAYNIASAADYGATMMQFNSGKNLTITANATITSQATGTVGLVVKGTALQTADLQQWQDSAGTVLSVVDSTGKMVLGRGGQLASATFTIQGNTSTYSPDNTSALANRIIFLRGNTSGNLMALTSKGDAAQGVAALVLTNGGFSTEITGFGYNGNIYTNLQSASTVGLTIKGASSQTANLQEWQNSSGSILASVSANGTFTSYGSNLGAFQSTGTSAGGYNGLTLTNNVGQNYLLGTAGASESAFSVASSFYIYDGVAGVMRLRLNSSGLVGINAIPTAQLHISNSTASNVGLIVNTPTSPTANIQEWQINGVTKAYVNTTGSFITVDSITASGSVVATNGVYANTGYIGAEISAKPFLTTIVGAIIRGAVSQTADLQQWQNSSGTVLTSIASDGHYIFPYNVWNRSAGDSQRRFYFSAYAQTFYEAGSGGHEFRRYDSTAHFKIGDNGNLSTTLLDASSIGLIIKGAASQTANLQEWQNSSGTVLASVLSGGAIAAPNFFAGYIASTMISAIASGPSNSGIIVRGYASQTANLQEWQNSSGTILTSVSKDGFVSIGAGSNTTYSDLNVWKSGEAAIDIVNTNWKSSSGRNAGQINFRVGGNSGERNNAVSAIRGLDLYSGGSYIGGLSFLTQGGGVADPVERARITNDGYLLVNTTSISAQLASVSAWASVPPLVIQHAASPTSSYFEIRNSSGTAIWGINLAGESLTRTTTKFGANIQNDSNNNNNALNISAPSSSGTGIALYVYSGSTTKDIAKFDNNGTVKLTITSDGSLKGGNSNTISANTATTVDTVALSSFTTIEYVVSIKQGSKIRSSKVLVHTDGTSVDSTEYGIMEMGGGITGIIVTASVSGTDSILQVTITDAATTNATVKLIKTML